MLVLYSRQLIKTPHEASTVEEHVGAFKRHSRFTVWQWNARLGYPEALDMVDPAVVVLHYSMFGSGFYVLDDQLRHFLQRTRARKVAFFQDEMAWMRLRFAFVDQYGIDTVYTHIAERDFDATWGRYTSVPEVVHNYPGYVSDAMLEGARRWALPDQQRDIDVGYRGRPLPSWLGRGAQEKTVIGEEFARRAAGRGLRFDISTREDDRLYGDDWHRFLGRCRAVLGVESGVSYLDLEDEVLAEHQRVLAERGSPPTLEELEAGVLVRWENNFRYRTISPRHLEAAAFGVCQVLFTGEYEGLLDPGKHYIALEKDFSNLDDVIEQLRDGSRRREIAENAHRDLIASGTLSYARFLATVDERLIAKGLDPTCPPRDRAALGAALSVMHARRGWRKAWSRRERLREQALWGLYRTIAPVSRRVRRALGLPRKEV
jgi:hypothetical protein